MVFFFRKRTSDDKEIAKTNKMKADTVPTETTVTHIMIEQPNAKYLKETSKALQIILNQERDFYQTMPRDEEYRKIKEYLEAPNEEDFYEVLEREKELEIKRRFNTPRHFDIPKDMVDIMRNNFEIEREALENTMDKSKNNLTTIQDQIKKLRIKEKQLINEIEEQNSYDALATTIEEFLKNPTDAKEWGMNEENINGLIRKRPSWLKFSLQRAGCPQIFTETNRKYYRTKMDQGGTK